MTLSGAHARDEFKTHRRALAPAVVLKKSAVLLRELPQFSGTKQTQTERPLVVRPRDPTEESYRSLGIVFECGILHSQGQIKGVHAGPMSGAITPARQLPCGNG